MMALTSRQSPPPYLFKIMKFTLTYTGELPSLGNPRGPHKSAPKLPVVWAIRNEFAKQLEYVLNNHPARTSSNSTSSRAAYNILRSPIKVGEFNFLPLVRPEFETVCGLKIKMMVNHEVGSLVTQAGDLDNRIKTLLDALRLPKGNEFNGNGPAEDNCPCLLHDDALVVSLKIEVQRWFSGVPKTEKDVYLDIEVAIWTARPNFYTPTFGIE
jgi:hypothetical protein